MGINTPSILTGHVMHQRHIPKKHGFRYGIFYVALPLSRLKSMHLPYNRFGLLSFYDQDHGPCDGTSLTNWAHSVLAMHDIDDVDEITLVCMPRVLGYVFNPVSFWLCQDEDGLIKAVLCEVHNTFGERHSYICKPADKHVHIDAQQVLKAEKAFHVSPFLKREGHYAFRFDLTEQQFNVFIDYFNAAGEKQLVTSLTTVLAPQTRPRLKQMFWQYPLVTLKAIVLIHWHALKLVAKGIRYISKPMQKTQRMTSTSTLQRIFGE